VKRLVIVGAGGYGREMCGAACAGRLLGIESFAVKGFLDDNPHALDGFADCPPILGSLAGYAPQADDVFITAFGNLATRRRAVETLAAKGAAFATLVATSAFLGPRVTVGAGSFIAPGVALTADIRIGRHAAVFHNTSIGHDAVLGDFCHVYAQCSLGGAVKVGDGAQVFPGAVVVPRRTIGAGATVGAGSTVVLNVEPGVTVFGSPAAPVT